jgi:hypothetical protein
MTAGGEACHDKDFIKISFHLGVSTLDKGGGLVKLPAESQFTWRNLPLVVATICSKGCHSHGPSCT